MLSNPEKVWDPNSGMWDVECGMWNVECGILDVLFLLLEYSPSARLPVPASQEEEQVPTGGETVERNSHNT